MSLVRRAVLGSSVAGLVLGLAACGGDAPVPRRQRLTELPSTLHDLPHEAAVELLRQEFDAVPEDWHVITGTQDVLAASPDALRRSVGKEDGRGFLTLAGTQGALYQVLSVEGDTPYRFSGALRARGVVSSVTPFPGALFWVAESSKSGSPAELFGAGKRFDLLHGLPSVAGVEGWQEQHVAFRTRPETRTLIVGCVLAVDVPLTAGEVDFDRLLVERIDERELWAIRAAEGVASAYRGDALPPKGDWRARRSLGAMLGAERRPAVLALPGERLEFTLDVPAEDPVLTCGLGPWPAAYRAGVAPSTHWVRVDGRELLKMSNPAVPLGERTWQEATIELTQFAGKRVRLELGVDGPQPGVFGAPQVVARAPAASAAKPWNVLLVSIDTLRPERVGAYGATSGVTPNLDALAREGTLFTDVTANAPYTLPAHATLLTGQFPSVHGVEDRGRVLAPERSPLLARTLAARGYRTQAFVAGGFLTPDFGFHAGFDGFSIVDPLRHPGSKAFADVRRELPDQDLDAWTGGPGVERVRAWLAEHAAEPFFLFVHTYEVHDYDPPPELVDCAARGCTSTLTDFRELSFPKKVEPFPGTPEDRTHVEHLYDAALKHVDAELGLIVGDLRARGLLDRTLVVVVSDHGEEWFERGHLQHGKTLYGEQLRIPWILRVPGRAPARVATPAMQVDVLPTVLGALGLASDARIQGVDLLATTPKERPLWSEVHDHFAAKASLRMGNWKLVHGPLDADVRLKNEHEWELYDLAADPRETQDKSAAEPARLLELRRTFEGFAEHLRTTSEALGPLEEGGALDEATRRLLEGLGYF